MTNGPCSAIRTPADGRPAPWRGVPSTGSTRSVMPSASSSLTSAAMVLRLSPMRPVSSAREI